MNGISLSGYNIVNDCETLKSYDTSTALNDAIQLNQIMLTCNKRTTSILRWSRTCFMHKVLAKFTYNILLLDFNEEVGHRGESKEDQLKLHVILRTITIA